MAFTFPYYASKLSQPVSANNFTPCQSAQLAVSTSSASRTFTCLPGSATRQTYKITNSGLKGCYIAAGIGSATAVVSGTTPTPISGTAISTCDYVGAGAILQQDYPAGYDTIAAICAGSDSTTLEISIGYGQ